MTKVAHQFERRERLHKIHVLSALIVAAWLLMLALTGVAINHQEALGLTELQVSDSLLPGFYRADVRTGSTPLLIVLTDLHSGRIFGSYGYLLTDAIAMLVVLSAVSGLLSYRLRKKVLQNSRSRASANGVSQDA